MSHRVISGSAKGRRLKAVPGDSTRPVTDRVKEAIFNILASDVDNSSWWDVFAGTGAVGIEALSRGAAFVRFGELNRQAIETIRWNLQHTRLAEQGEIRRGDAFALLAGHPDQSFDFIYIAPPQYLEMWSKSLALIDDNLDWLSEGGCIIVQIHPREFQALDLHNLEIVDERKYGSTLVLFFEPKGKP
ncbi:MAG: 16S rRNA (guanine(966)-N(2))-methyltransferase RsmD [Chloroflexota bacterium]